MCIHSPKTGFSVCTEDEQTLNRGETDECVDELLENPANIKKTKQNTRNSKKKKKVKRGRKKPKEEYLNIFSTNAAQLKGKIESFKSELKVTNASVFTIQETHYLVKGKFIIEEFEIFEAIRSKVKGGTAIGVKKGLKPVLIEEYSDDFELIVIKIKAGNKDIRIISGYGPQENWPEAARKPFFLALEEEVVKAELAGKSLIIEMDANSKLGPQLIPGDKHQ